MISLPKLLLAIGAVSCFGLEGFVPARLESRLGISGEEKDA